MSFGKGYKIANFLGSFGISSPDIEEKKILQCDLRSINSRIYDLHRNNPVAGAISRIMTEYVGNTGYKLNVPQSPTLQKLTEKWMKNCTVRGDDYETFRKNRITEITQGGGVLTLFTQNDNRREGEVGLKLDLVEAGRVTNPPEFPDSTPKNGKQVYNGIAYNTKGEEIGFYYKDGDSHKYIEKYNSAGMLKAFFERSPEDERPNVSRPLPLIARAVEPLEMRDKIFKNMATFAKNSSGLGMMFTTPDPSAVMQGFGMKDNEGNLDTEELAGKTQIAGEIAPELIGMAPVGTDVKFITPEGSMNFEPIFKIINREVSLAVGIPEEILANATDGKNFAVSKFVSQSFIKKIQTWARALNKLDSIIIKHVWQEMDLRDLYEFDYNESIEWGGSADFDDVDASKSADASQKRVSGLNSTYSKETARKGGDFEDNVDTTIKEMMLIRDKAEKAGFKFIDYMTFIRGEGNVGVSISTTAEKVEEEDINEDD